MKLKSWQVMPTVEDCTPARVKDVLDRLADEYDAGVSELARVVREKYIIPLCDKHRLRFTAGNGSWSFDDEKGNYWVLPDDQAAHGDSKRTLPRRLVEIDRLPLLNHYWSLLATYTEDYQPKDWKRK
jgi:hypothetical protein